MAKLIGNPSLETTYADGSPASLPQPLNVMSTGRTDLSVRMRVGMVWIEGHEVGGVGVHSLTLDEAVALGIVKVTTPTP